VGYGGVVVRDKVAKGADWFVNNFEVGLQGEREGERDRERKGKGVGSSDAHYFCILFSPNHRS
jgi:hypothetical protein